MLTVRSYLTKLFLRTYISLVRRDKWSLKDRRRRYELFRQRFLKTPPSLICEKFDIEGVPAEWMSFPESRSDRTVLYLHGGAFVMCSIESHRHLIAQIARACEARVLAIDYRLAPEFPYPAALQDAMTAYKYLIKKTGAPQQIALIGDSAGGGLAVSLLIAMRDGNQPMPAAVVCLCPWVDLTAGGESIVTKAREEFIIPVKDMHLAIEAYLNGADPKTPTISPIFADLRGLPPMLIQAGTSEVLLDDARRLAKRAQECDVAVTLEIWEQMIHVWHFFSSVMPEARQAIARVGQFVRENIAMLKKETFQK